jgi:ribonucleoside-diphosphate reductase alpha chain
MAQDMLTAYKLGWKTSYYQNTYDFKGEEEDVQPAGIETQLEDEGEDVILEPENPAPEISTTTDIDGEECDACMI